MDQDALKRDQGAIQHENKEINEQLSKSNEDLKKEQTKTQELNRKLYICEANQGVSTTFNISCQFVKIKDEYSCETQDILVFSVNCFIIFLLKLMILHQDNYFILYFFPC